MAVALSKKTLADAVVVSSKSADDRFRLYKVNDCVPQLRLKIRQVLTAMDALGWPMLITDGFRTVAEQQRLYAQSRTAPGPRVTDRDGVLNKSNHQSGRACDCTFIDHDTGKPTWDLRYPWAAYGACVEAVGLKWGGRAAGPLHDQPHAELHEG